MFVVFVSSTPYSLSVAKGLYAFGELFIPAKNEHSARESSDTVLLK